MRFPDFECLFVFSTLATVAACTSEEYSNPPATRDGTEATGEDSKASLPAPSTPPSSSSSSGGAETKDSGADPKPVGPTSGVDPDKTIGELDASEKKKLCDWQAAVGGGYGKTTKCEGGVSTSTPKSQSACVQELNIPSCQATVGEVEVCMKVDAQAPCALAVLTAPECESLRACAQ